MIVSPGDSAAFTATIERLIDDTAARTEFGAVARRCADERWNKEVIINQLEQHLVALAANSSPVSAADGVAAPDNGVAR